MATIRAGTIAMDLRHLQTFAKAAEFENFTRAAEALDVTQAAVSQHVAALEKELHVSLFERAGRSIALTEAGRCLYEYTCKVLDLLDEARRAVGQVATAVCGTLRIAVCTIPPETFLPEMLTRLREQYPDVQQLVTVSDSTEATLAVETGAADVAIVGELPRGSSLQARAIATDELVLVVPPDHPLTHMKDIDPGRLLQETFIVREPGSGSRHCIEQALDDAGIDPSELSIAMEMNSNEAIRSAVQQGAGIAFLSRSAVQRELADGTLVAVHVPAVQARRHLHLVIDPSRITTPAARAFLAFVEQWQTETANEPRPE